jgi:hypothetical protein
MRPDESYFAINCKSAPGVDKVSWKSYGEQLWENLTDLTGRLVRGDIPQADGRDDFGDRDAARGERSLESCFGSW